MSGPPITVFLDESGNTGPDLASNDQPVFVLAGWMVKRPDVRTVQNIVAQSARAADNGATEVKSSRWLGNARREAVAAELFATLIRNGLGLPVFILSEKRYCLAAKLVETFLDPPVNPLFPRELVGDALEKRKLAHQIYGLSDVVLSRAWRAIRDCEARGIEDALEEIIDGLSGLGFQDASELWMGARNHGQRIAELERAGSNNAKAHGSPAFSLVVLAGDISRTAERLGVRAKVVHDETASFQPVLDDFFELGANAAHVDIALNNNNVMHLGWPSLDKLTFSVSRNDLVIQAADLLAGSLRALANNRPVPSRPLLDALRTVVAVSLAGEGSGTLFIASDSWVEQFTVRLDSATS